MDQIRETLSKAANDVSKTVGPLIEQASAATKPYVDQASAATKPYLDQASAATKPYIDQASAATKPYIDSASAALHDTAAKINTAITGEPASGANVDTTHIGALSPTEEKKLDDAIAHRPTAKELQDKNILKDTKVAPGLQAAQSELEKARVGDALDAKLGNRPDAADLESKGILKK